MAMDKVVKKRMFLFSLSIIMILFVAVSASYAFNNTLPKDSSIEYNNDLKIEFINGNIVTNTYPLSYNEGSNNKDVSIINITNETMEKKEYNLYVETLDSENNINPEKMYIKINDQVPQIIVPGKSLYTGKLKRKGTEQLNIRVWVSSELVDNLDQGKTSSLKFIVK